MVRAPMYDKNGIKKGAWSRDEDEKLTSYIHRYGHWNWRLLPKFAGLKRCGKSCRLRWMNYLRPELKHGNFSGQEDALIIKLHERFGNRWSTIAASLPGRTDNEVKNHWHSHLKKKPRKCDEKEEPKPSTSCCESDEDTQNSECDAQSILITDTISNIILESSPVSPPTYSTTQLSSNVIEGIQDHTCFRSSAQSSTGDFWSQPFVADSFTDYNQNAYPSSSENGGFEIYDDMYFDDLLYQLIQ